MTKNGLGLRLGRSHHNVIDPRSLLRDHHDCVAARHLEDVPGRRRQPQRAGAPRRRRDADGGLALGADGLLDLEPGEGAGGLAGGGQPEGRGGAQVDLVAEVGGEEPLVF